MPQCVLIAAASACSVVCLYDPLFGTVFDPQPVNQAGLHRATGTGLTKATKRSPLSAVVNS